MNQERRKLSIGSISTVIGNVRSEGPALVTVTDELEPILLESDWFAKAPFKYIVLIFMLGAKTDLNPVFRRISRKYCDLPLSVDLSMEEIQDVQRDRARLEEYYRKAAIEALLAVAVKYNLPKQCIEEYKAENIQS